LAIFHVCDSCHDLVEALASKQLDDLHYLILLKCGHYFIIHEYSEKFYDPTKERDYVFEIKKIEDGSYWQCDHCHKRHCHKCDGVEKVYCCKCYYENFNSEWTPPFWCDFCKFWYREEVAITE